MSGSSKERQRKKFLQAYADYLAQEQKKAWERFNDPVNIARWNRHATWNNEVRNSIRAIFRDSWANLCRILRYFRDHWRDLRHAPWRRN